MNPKNYDSTVARMAGNIAPALLALTGTSFPASPSRQTGTLSLVAKMSVQLAREIIAEVKRTESSDPVA